MEIKYSDFLKLDYQKAISLNILLGSQKIKSLKKKIRTFLCNLRLASYFID